MQLWNYLKSLTFQSFYLWFLPPCLAMIKLRKMNNSRPQLLQNRRSTAQESLFFRLRFRALLLLLLLLLHRPNIILNQFPWMVPPLLSVFRLLQWMNLPFLHSLNPHSHRVLLIHLSFQHSHSQHPQFCHKLNFISASKLYLSFHSRSHSLIHFQLDLQLLLHLLIPFPWVQQYLCPLLSLRNCLFTRLSSCLPSCMLESILLS